MQHMPYERMQADDEAEDTSKNPAKRHASVDDEPGRTPHTAEGQERTERKMPVVEPGRTPDPAVGE